MTATVTLENLEVAFHGHTVLHAVNAHFPARSISVLVGRSGSGKTTLLRAVNRLNEEFPGCATKGRVRVDFGQGARDIYGAGTVGRGADTGAESLPLLRQRMGMLFQTPNCFPVSVYRNIAMPLALVGGVPDSDMPPRVRTALELVGLWETLKDRLHSPAERLSGGQQQRLCLARLLALRPAVLLLDEPTASLDVHASRDIEQLLQELAKTYTVIMVSHSLSQARRMGQQVLVCHGGRIVERVVDPARMNEAALADMLDAPL